MLSSPLDINFTDLEGIRKGIPDKKLAFSHVTVGMFDTLSRIWHLLQYFNGFLRDHDYHEFVLVDLTEKYR